MNRLPSATACGVCGFAIHQAWLRTADWAVRDNLRRQAQAGICDGCQRKRQAAAVAFIVAYDRLRVAWRLITDAGADVPFAGTIRVMSLDLQNAEAACVALKMWPDGRDAPADRFADHDYRWRRAMRKTGTEETE